MSETLTTEQDTSELSMVLNYPEVERATPGEEVLGSILAVAARSLLVGSVSV